MKISENGLKLIETFEGFLAKASNTLDGVWTIGYGQTGYYYGSKICKGMTTTKEKAHAWLRDHSIKTYEACVDDAVKVSLGQNQFDALVSFTYNIGCAAFRKSTVLKKLNAGDYSGAADAFSMWVRCNGKVLHGLVNRREKEAALFRKDMVRNYLMKGDSGAAVLTMQKRLNICGALLLPDGIWGIQTETAVRNFQRENTLVIDGLAGQKTMLALAYKSIIERAKKIGNYLVSAGWHYKSGKHVAQDTFILTTKEKYPASTCSHFVSWVLQDVELLTATKRISHKDGGKLTGSEYLIDCEVVNVGGKLYSEIAELRAGDVCLFDSNLAIYAGDGKWYDAGGPFKANTTATGKYKKVCGVAPYYDRHNKIYALIRPKV